MEAKHSPRCRRVHSTDDSSTYIYEFNAGGQIIGNTSDPNGVGVESLKITPNGNLLYCLVTGNDTNELRIIGPSSLMIGEDPSLARCQQVAP